MPRVKVGPALPDKHTLDIEIARLTARINGVKLAPLEARQTQRKRIGEDTP
jgi:hypothetical protein